ncbi:LysR family transcriptional regulator [Paenibacillus sp. YPG26]|uniref:LysR family transcriptional regulator n=1 Tax=Paenibacillus sp. YPG26 TaxID=2878915 RepID=UPI002041FDE6|nr:LysR family transcriptional regulator [Paenibacillus sp. YPG26]USB31998.1 LysR family transcriptional regulator [Paenibacillus sp. YPG26]
MDLRQMRYFLAIAKAGQITKAAKLLNMEQPPLSRQLKLMEQELGVTLFDRTGKSLRLTPSGELLRDRSETLLLQFNETLKEVKEYNEGIQGSLSIGSVVSCISLLPRPIELFREQYPGVTFKITEGDHFLLGDQLVKGMIELIVARLPFEADLDEQFEILPLPSDPYVAVVPSASFPMDGARTMNMRELADLPFLTLKTDQTTRMHEQVLQECRRHGFEPNIICECSSVAIIIALVAAGIGATVLPESVMSAFPIPRIRTMQLSDAHFQSDVGLVWLKERYLTKSARRFIERFAEDAGY